MCIIGITLGFNRDGDLFLRRHYCEAIRRAGGSPILLPPLLDPREALRICDGILFTGGGDIDPRGLDRALYADYDEALLASPNAERDGFELPLARLAYERDLPSLGICRGLQIMNAALGGTLIFDLPGHRQTLERHQTSHSVSVSADSRLCTLIGKQAEVNSFHHQTLDRLAPGMKAAAHTTGGAGNIEAAEDPTKRFWLGVQWHPEHLTDEGTKKLFAAFVKAANSR